MENIARILYDKSLEIGYNVCSIIKASEDTPIKNFQDCARTLDKSCQSAGGLNI